MPSRGYPVPPEGRRWGPAKSHCVNGFAGGRLCGVVFWICRHCDRGHRYCGERCRRKARRRQRRAANRRHQQSREGRLDHRDRQRNYRERRRLRRVTDQPSPAASDSDSIVVAEPSLSENGSESVSGEDRYVESAEFEPACIICGRRTLRSAPVQELQCPVPAVENRMVQPSFLR